MAAMHVVPRDDRIAHSLFEDGDCVCGPRTEPVCSAEGAVTGWLTIHHSLDGREKLES